LFEALVGRPRRRPSWVLSIIILVATFNILSSLIMMVRAKTKRHRHPAHDGRQPKAAADAHLHDRRHDRSAGLGTS
jgi:ABC-type nickel/cobalt efflux system permease component RcnA